MSAQNSDLDPFGLPDEVRLRIEDIDDRLVELDRLEQHLLDERNRLITEHADS
jgi:hypothetical protein